MTASTTADERQVGQVFPEEERAPRHRREQEPVEGGVLLLQREGAVEGEHRGEDGGHPEDARRQVARGHSGRVAREVEDHQHQRGERDRRLTIAVRLRSSTRRSFAASASPCRRRSVTERLGDPRHERRAIVPAAARRSPTCPGPAPTPGTRATTPRPGEWVTSTTPRPARRAARTASRPAAPPRGGRGR